MFIKYKRNYREYKFYKIKHHCNFFSKSNGLSNEP